MQPGVVQQNKREVTSRAYSPGEEVVSSLIHGIGAALSVAALVVLVSRALSSSDVQSVVAVSVYGATLVLLYLSSTLYHAVTSQRAKRAFKVADHAAIFLLIAGTYTAYSLSVVRGVLGWVLFGVIWSCALPGVVVELLGLNRNRLLATVLYVVMGALVVFVAGPVKAAMSSTSFTLLLLGGAAYVLGAIIYVMKQVPWTHPIWHLFVVAGSALHFFSILWTL
jgi:hemolysin III